MNSNPNHCDTCDYRQPDVSGAHCYMLADAPTTVCHAYTVSKERFRHVLAPTEPRKCLSCGAKEDANGNIPCDH